MIVILQPDDDILSRFRGRGASKALIYCVGLRSRIPSSQAKLKIFDNVDMIRLIHDAAGTSSIARSRKNPGVLDDTPARDHRRCRASQSVIKTNTLSWTITGDGSFV